MAQLADHHDTQDAFQATFLILIKKARALWIRDSLGPWLHQVALRTASCARSNAARRRRHERRAAEQTANRIGCEDRPSFELERVLHAEINRLPDCYRIPIVLCDLEAHSCEEAARRMGCPVGTVKSWRSRGRQRLRDRLIRLGLAPSAVMGATFAADRASAAVSEETVRNAMRALSQSITAGEASASVRILVKGVMKTMIIGKFWTTAAACFALVFLTAGLGAVAWGVADDSKRAGDEPRTNLPAKILAEQGKAFARASDEAQTPRLLTLPEAIQIGLENSAIIRVISIGDGVAPSRIAPLKGGADPEQFKSEVMAQIRAIEQQYWSDVFPAQAQVQRKASEQAVRLSEEILKDEQAALTAGRGTIASVAEAAQRLEQFNLDLVTRTSDVTTTERLLRNILGVTWPDTRPIIPVTVPTEARVENLRIRSEISLRVMLKNQPDVVRLRTLVKETRAVVSGNGLALVEQEKESLRQSIRKATSSLGRCLMEIDANYELFTKASRLSKTSARRLEAQRAYYKEGRITIDRLLDAVNQWATAVATEAQYKATYNVSIVALEEAKGTLLEYKQISVAAGPTASVSPAVAWFRGLARTKHEPPNVVSVPAQTGPLPPSPIQPVGPAATSAKDASHNDAAGSKTRSFQFTVGSGPNPIQIRGSFTITPAPSTDRGGSQR